MVLMEIYRCKFIHRFLGDMEI